MRNLIIGILLVFSVMGCGPSGGVTTGPTSDPTSDPAPNPTPDPAPATGNPYATVDWTSDIEGFDLSEIGITDSVIYKNTYYPLWTGSGTIYWQSSGIVYYLGVNVSAGTSGYDRLYETLFSGNTMYFTDTLVYNSNLLKIPPENSEGMIQNFNLRDR